MESPLISRITFSVSITSRTSDKYLLLNAILESLPDEFTSNITEFSPNSSVFEDISKFWFSSVPEISSLIIPFPSFAKTPKLLTADLKFDFGIIHDVELLSGISELKSGKLPWVKAVVSW